MSIDPITSTRFTNSFSEVGEDGRKYNESYIVDADDVDKFERKIKFNEQNVRNSTVLVGLAVLATSFVKGKSIIASVEKMGAFLGEQVAKGAVKVADVVTHGVEKLSKGKMNKTVDYASISSKIDNAFENFKIRQSKVNPTITEGLPKNIEKHFGENAGKRAKAVIKGLGINNGGDIARTACATLIGYEAMDAVTDKVEGVQDRHDNRSALKKLIRPAIEIDSIVSNGAALDVLEKAVNVA